MQTHDNSLRAAIKDVGTMMRETASRSEAAALKAVDRAEAALAGGRTTWERTQDIGDQVVQSIENAGRTTLNGVAEFSGVLGRYSKDALTDTMELGRRGIASKGAKELLDLCIEFVSRRSHAFFASIDELNAIAKASTFAVWSPMGDMLRKAGERASA